MQVPEGTAMELYDCAFSLLAGIDIVDNLVAGFDGANIALFVGVWSCMVGDVRAVEAGRRVVGDVDPRQ